MYHPFHTNVSSLTHSVHSHVSFVFDHSTIIHHHMIYYCTFPPFLLIGLHLPSLSYDWFIPYEYLLITVKFR